MDTKTETRKLADATANLAGTIIDIVDARLKATLEAGAGHYATLPELAPFKPQEGWVKKKDLAKHLNVSLRTVDNWIRKGDIPYIRLGGRKNLFMLSVVDEALKRRFQRNSSW